MIDNKVQLEVFEGPLDLLLYLVKKEEVDIYEVNLTRMATQFVEYVEIMRQLDLDIAGDFLVMASTLMYIKSRELLPVERQVLIEEEEAEDPRWELIRQLVEYKKFKDAASELQDREEIQDRVYPRQPTRTAGPADGATPRLQVSIFDLVNAVSTILKRFSERHNDARSMVEDRWTVSEKIEFLSARLAETDSFRFSELFADTTSRTEVVVMFLALLELIRLKRLIAIQAEPFGEIEIRPAPSWSEDASPTPTPIPTPD